MGILPKILDHRPGAVESLFAVRNPFLRIALIDQRLKFVMVPVLFRRAMKFKSPIFPKLLHSCQIFSPEGAGNDPDRQEELLPVVYPAVVPVQSAAKQDCMEMRMKIHLAPPGVKDTD